MRTMDQKKEGGGGPQTPTTVTESSTVIWIIVASFLYMTFDQTFIIVMKIYGWYTRGIILLHILSPVSKIVD